MPHDEKILRQVAHLHATCLADGFLTSLGPRFLTVLYRAIDRSDSSVLIVADSGAGITGFVAGGGEMKPIRRQMLRDWPALVAALAPLIFRPRLVKGMIEILGRGGEEWSGRVPEHELFSIAVAPSARGDGTADRLYSDLCAHFRYQGIHSFRIVVGGTLMRAHRFYTRMGAEPAGETRLHGSFESTVFVQSLRED